MFVVGPKAFRCSRMRRSLSRETLAQARTAISGEITEDGLTA